MSRIRLLQGSALFVAALFASSTAQSAPKKIHAKTATHQHIGHLHQALKDLHAAEAAVRTNNRVTAHRHDAAAIKQIEEAIHHHKAHIAALPGGAAGGGGGGLGGAIGKAVHHHHHSLLHEALAEARHAEHEIKSGNLAKASHHIHQAESHIQKVIAHGQVAKK